MADMPIYHPSTSKTEWKWGARHYYFDCHRDGGDYGWFRDNLETAVGSPKPEQITARWAFDGKWDPEATMAPVLPFAFLPSPHNHAKNVNRKSVMLVWIPGRNAESHAVYFGTTNPPQRKGTSKEAGFGAVQLKPRTTYYWRVDTITDEGVVPGTIWNFTTGN